MYYNCPVAKSTKKVLVGGCFDLIHFGHIHFLKKAKAMGDFLVIALESDANVRRLKGKGRPVHNQNQRKTMLEAISFVDKVIALPKMDSDKHYRALVKRVSPKIIAVTRGDGMIDKKKQHAKAVGATVREISKLKVSSTSDILKKLEKHED